MMIIAEAGDAMYSGCTVSHARDCTVWGMRGQRPSAGTESRQEVERRWNIALHSWNLPQT